METGLPEDAEAVGVQGIRARGGAAQQGELSSELVAVAAHHRRVNSEVCGREVAVVESWELSPKYK